LGRPGGLSGGRFRGRGRKETQQWPQTNSGVAWNGTDAGKVADTELYVAVVKRTEKVLLKELDASQDQLERYLPSDGNRNSMQVALKAVKMEKGAVDDQDMEATFTLW
jgi:hypothetical protein